MNRINKMIKLVFFLNIQIRIDLDKDVKILNLLLFCENNYTEVRTEVTEKDIHLRNCTGYKEVSLESK